jgi:hypothetical protein
MREFAKVRVICWHKSHCYFCTNKSEQLLSLVQYTGLRPSLLGPKLHAAFYAARIMQLVRLPIYPQYHTIPTPVSREKEIIVCVFQLLN